MDEIFEEDAKAKKKEEKLKKKNEKKKPVDKMGLFKRIIAIIAIVAMLFPVCATLLIYILN